MGDTNDTGITATLSNTESINKLNELTELLKIVKLYTEAYRIKFIECGKFIEDSNSRNDLANEIAENMYVNISYDLKAAWKQDRIHKKIAILGNIIQKTTYTNSTVLWRPKCGDIKQQLLNKSTNYKLLYKSFLENELMKKLKDTKSTESKVTQLCQKLDDVQKRIQIQTLKLNALNETVKCHIEKTRI
ncbi:uncharacterized protein LOC113366827 [Ctenocephalides felis]|uniref:uncharacterized protein LOC113366827 n=1 Tax=Ctenocephalides felis TaxID=7515 RepID=UPI000E6E10B3|nr:uncharacterized protein LOC113366827 [Ctenocephalides felis]